MSELTPAQERYLAETARTRDRRMAWWREARFGMFVHWGLYSLLGRHEWAMHWEGIPVAEYEPLAGQWKPKPRPMREWAALAKRAGMAYMVMTTKHHEGFLLWDSKMSDYNARQRGPGRDLVREYVDCVRAAGLKVGFYYSLMDWHHPDGRACLTDLAARRRFLDYTQGCVRELCSNYGKIDILWYDVPSPLRTAEEWESYRMNAMVRKLQPGILINNRSRLPEDFGTPEEHVKAEAAGRDWEACMTFNGSWGWQKTPPEDWRSAREVIGLLRTCAAGGGNLLLNIGPKPDGSVPREAVERLTRVGQWLDRNGGIIRGRVDRVGPMPHSAMGAWTRKGKRFFFWCSRWGGSSFGLGPVSGRIRSACLYPDGRLVRVTQTPERTVLSGLPAACPDPVAGVGVIQVDFRELPVSAPSADRSPCVQQWQVSRLLPKRGGVARAPCARLSNRALAWQTLRAGSGEPDFVNLSERFGTADGLAYVGNRFRVRSPGLWRLQVGHDGGMRLFVDGRPVLCVPERVNPAKAGRSCADVRLARGVHEIMIAFDTDGGMGQGLFFSFRRLGRAPGTKYFPELVPPGKETRS